MNAIGISSGAKLTRSPETEYDKKNGNATTYTYEATTEAEIDAQRILEISKGATRIQKRPRGDGYWELVSSFPFGEDGGGAEPPQDVHELEVNVGQPTVYQSLKLRSFLGSDPDTILSILHSVVSKHGSHDYDGNDTRLNTVKAEAALVAAVAGMGENATVQSYALKAFRGIAARGIESFFEYSTVYRRTLTAATPQQVRASFVGVGKIWTTAEMVAFEVLPADWWFTIPTDLQWLKSQPQVNTVWGSKTQITYSYIESKRAWYLIYDAYGSAVLLDAP